MRWNGRLPNGPRTCNKEKLLSPNYCQSLVYVFWLDNAVFHLILSNGQVVTRLGLSYSNARALNQIIDHELPDRPPWRKVPICLQGSEDTFYLYHRDVMECLRALWSKPSLCGDRMYAPQKQFADHHHHEQLRNEMNTGDWWWKTQVSTWSFSVCE